MGMFSHGKKLATLVALGLLATANSALAVQKEYFYYGDKVIAELNILSADEAAQAEVIRLDDDYLDEGYTYWDLPAALVTGLKDATTYWTDMIGAGAKNTQPWQIVVYAPAVYGSPAAGYRAYNANGDSVLPLNYIAQAIQDGKVLARIDDFSVAQDLLPSADTSFSYVIIKQNMGVNTADGIHGYLIDSATVLPTCDEALDFVGICRHEAAHALGLETWLNELDDTSKTMEGQILGKTIYVALYGGESSYSAHLIDQNGNRLDRDKIVLTGEDFAILKAHNPDIKAEDYFIADYIDVYGYGQTLDSPMAGNAYFIGDNVTEVLDGATFDGVSGLRANVWDAPNGTWEGDPTADVSHININGMMSHTNYRNYTTFLEAELAVMQDIGYQLDRRAYYGRSIYNNGQTINNTQGYFARNAAGTDYVAGTYSNVDLGIGLHIYGYQNDVTQSADILTRGTGAVGVRMDGYENKLTIGGDTSIHADGQRGMGLLVSYGRSHELNQYGTVTALGTGGRAAVFDFGSNMLGGMGDYRGSYINFYRYVDDGEIYLSWNWNATDLTDKGQMNIYNYTYDELVGALVDNYNIAGTLAGAEDAIYISKNAFVKNINVNAGASLAGDITSEWKHFDTSVGSAYGPAQGTGGPVMINYNDSYYSMDSYVPDLVTQLNINTDLTYSGNISGADNMALNITRGTLNYSGAADVVNATVSEGATVVGGSYTVNDMTANAPAEYATEAETTGKFTNHGTISAASQDESLSITGALVSDGKLVGIAGGTGGKITVDGTADVTGSTVSVVGALPGESTTVLTASGGITGTLANNTAEKATATSGLLSTYASADASGTLTAHAVAQDNIGAKSEREAAGYAAVTRMQAALAGDTRADELRPLYSLDAAHARQALGRIASSDLRGSMATATQRSGLNNQLVANRLHNLWKTQSLAQLNKPQVMSGMGWARNVALTMDDELTLPTSDALPTSNVTLRTTPPEVDTNTWVNITKNWGELKGAANYHGQAISAGYDWASGANSRSGVFISYRASSLGADSSSASLHDTRVGYYTGSKTGAVERSLYADIGWQHGKTARYILGGLTASGRESSNLYELGGRLGYDLHHDDGRLWHVTPYIAAQGSWLRSKGYSETGAGIYNHHVTRSIDRYFGAQLGLTLERPIHSGTLTLDVGVRHAFSGGELYRSYRYEGDPGHTYRLATSQDHTHGIASLTCDTELTRGWHVTADTRLERGPHDHDLSASLALKRMW